MLTQIQQIVSKRINLQNARIINQNNLLAYSPILFAYTNSLETSIICEPEDAFLAKVQEKLLKAMNLWVVKGVLVVISLQAYSDGMASNQDFILEKVKQLLPEFLDLEFMQQQGSKIIVKTKGVLPNFELVQYKNYCTAFQVTNNREPVITSRSRTKTDFDSVNQKLGKRKILLSTMGGQVQIRPTAVDISGQNPVS